MQTILARTLTVRETMRETINKTLCRSAIALLFLVAALNLAKAQYLETFSTPNKGYLLNCVNDVTGVGWTLTAWDPAGTCQTSDLRDVDDYFNTTADGVLESSDLDQEVCWQSPLINISAAGTVTFSVGLSWASFDVDAAAGLCAGDYIKVLYSVNGGAYTMVPNPGVAFGGNACATVAYPFSAAPGPYTSSGTVTQGSISGNTLQIRVCVYTNQTADIVKIDNVSVPQTGVTTGCAAPSISTLMTQSGSCNNANGSIRVTATGATPGYNVSWGGPSSGNPGGTEIASSGGSYTITPLNTGTYTITVTDAATCSATTSVQVTAATALALNTLALPVSCSGLSNGEIDLTVSNGVPPYTYSWSNLPAAGDPQDQTGLAAGTYSVTVTDNVGCTAPTSATVGTASAGAYLETFSGTGNGILDGSTCSGANGTTCTNGAFAGVNWSMYGIDIPGATALSGIDAGDYFKTTGGKLEGKDFDGIVCWESPELDINPPGTGVGFSVDLTWSGFDQEPSGGTPDLVADHIDVEYSLNGGAWTRVLPNQAGGGVSGHTIVYGNGSGNDLAGSTTVSVSGLTGTTLRIRVCGYTNSDTELFTIDNVSVPSAQSLACPQEINLKQSATNIADGGAFNYGTVNVGSNDSKTFTIENTGSFTLNLTGTPPNYVTKGGTNPGDFTITQPANAAIAGDGSTTFTVVFAPGAPGARSCTLSISNNDSDENPYDVTLNGTGVAVCPTFSGAPPNVTVTANSVCGAGCTSSGGSLALPSGTPCPAGSTLQYQVNGSWSNSAPTYNQNGPAQTIKTRCTCDADANTSSAESVAVITSPGTCTPPNAAISIMENNVFFNQFSNLAYYNVSYTDGILCTGPFVPNPSTSATLTATGGGTYLWSTSATTAAITVSTAGTYTVVVTDALGCQSTVSQTISVNAAPSTGTISAVPLVPNSSGFGLCNNATLTLSSTVPGGVWDAFDKTPSPNIVSTDPQTGLTTPLFTSFSVDSHSVFYRVALNGCINSARVTITVLDAPNAGVISGTTSICPATTTQLSSNGTTAANTIRTWSSSNTAAATVNPSTGLVTGVAPGMTTITYTVTDFAGFSTAPILLCTSTASTVVTVLNCSVIDFSGKIVWENNNSSGVNNATVNLGGSATGSDITDVNGDFNVTVTTTGSNFTLKPVKNLNKLYGVTVADISAIQQHAANIVIIANNYKKVCADVNKSNSITTTDATILNQALLNNAAALAQFSSSWRFAPSSHTMLNPPWGFPEQRNYSNISGNQTNQDFIGMKIGDVVSTSANPANFGAGESLVLRARDRVLQSGESFELTFGADQLDDLAAFQLGLSFDPALLQFNAVEPLAGLPIGPEHFGLSDVDKGELRVAWSQAQSLAVQEAAPVFRLRFTALKGGVKLSEALQLDDAVLPALAYNAALAESKIELRFSAVSATGDPLGAKGVQLLQNRPNPFNNATAIGFVLPEACEAQLRIFDVSGRLLTERKGRYPAGKQEERFELGSVSGVLYYELTTPFGVLARKMTTLK